MQYYYNDKPIIYSSATDQCPICGGNLLLKKQKPVDGCIKIRYYKCVKCDFDSRKLELKDEK